MDYPAGDPFSDMTYNYDPVGNRDSTVNGGTVDYQNNELNEYTSVGGVNHTSDLRGNLTSDGSQSYTYDLDNRLTGVGQNISYKYDPFGKRIEKNVSSSVTRYIHSGDQIIEEWEGETLARKYVYGVGIDEPQVMITSGGSKYYYHFDALGSVRNLTDSSGSTVASYKYNVYGQFDLTGSSHGNPYTFTGRQWDSESGLYYYRARYYSPAVGRFLQTDPIGYHDGPNLYTYVLNNPLIFTDPMGLCGGDGGGGICIEKTCYQDEDIEFTNIDCWYKWSQANLICVAECNGFQEYLRSLDARGYDEDMIDYALDSLGVNAEECESPCPGHDPFIDAQGWEIGPYDVDIDIGCDCRCSFSVTINNLQVYQYQLEGGGGW